MLLNKNKAFELIKLLNKSIKNPKTSLKYRNKFTLLTSVVLSAQCTDVNVNNVTKNIYKNYSRKIAIFKSVNMSLGINLLEYIVNILSKKIPNTYEIGISDNHHKMKVDYPSGTALMLANAVSKGKNKNLESIKGKTFLNKKGNLQKNKINFFITRKGNTIGKHSVIFDNKIENIEIKHTAFSRELFADGALNAAIWINKKNKGLFNMRDMFGLK